MSKNNILTSADVFEKNKLPIRVRYTESSSELGFHSHEFTEIAIMFSGVKFVQPTIKNTSVSAKTIISR